MEAAARLQFEHFWTLIRYKKFKKNKCVVSALSAVTTVVLNHLKVSSGVVIIY